MTYDPLTRLAEDVIEVLEEFGPLSASDIGQQLQRSGDYRLPPTNFINKVLTENLKTRVERDGKDKWRLNNPHQTTYTVSKP